ncbi:MAG: response regulator [Lachnospiraceae bacterium]|nr:response regulator [Lachnospiraceae bacterium]
MSENKKGLTLIVSAKESFLAKGLLNKLKENGVNAEIADTRIKDLEPYREEAELFILFMTAEMEESTDAIVYIKDMAGDLDRKIILVGEQEAYEEVIKIIPEQLVLEWFNRPLDMEKLLKCIGKYLEENTGENAKKSILIVDDDITYMRMVYEWLKDKYHVGMASSGVQAISYLARNKADLVLLDYEMPIANGPQVLEMLKSDSETDSIPVMFLTGHGEKESVLSVVSLQPADYLLKTIDKPTLLGKLDAFFSHSKNVNF